MDLEENKILALGSRLFDAGENPDNGSSLAAPRRIKRSMRRRLFRRRQRLSNILKLCQRHGLLEKNSLASHSLTALEKTAGLLGNDPWVLRSEALRRKLSGEELARALYHLAKFRGFKSSLKDKKILEETDSNANQETKETKKMLSGIKDLKAKLAEAQAPTIGDFLLKSFQEKKLSRLHNAPGSYQQTMVRDLAEAEAHKILAMQRELGLQLDPSFDEVYFQQAFYQRPLKSSYESVGFCRFETEQKRAAKAAHSAELYVAYNELNKLQLKFPLSDESKALTQEQKTELINLAYSYKGGVSYGQVRTFLKKKFAIEGEYYFNLLNYTPKIPKQKKGEELTEIKIDPEKLIKDTEKKVFLAFPAWHKFKNNLSPKTFKTLTDAPKVLDCLGEILTFYQSDEDTFEQFDKQLRNINLSQEERESLANLSFTGTVALSLAAIYKILPKMQNENLRYDEAALAVYGPQNSLGNGDKNLLPGIDKNEIRNPVVLRALSQSRQVINAIIKRFGMPDRIQVEMLRELAKNYKERKEHNEEQKNYTDYLDSLRKEAMAALTVDEDTIRRGELFTKYRLWKEQQSRCLYSGAYIDIPTLKNGNLVEIDHGLNFSVSFDNSYNNKVLVLKSANQNKGNQSIYEYLAPQGQWETFKARLSSLPDISATKKERLLITDLSQAMKDNFKARNFVDSSYIARFFKNFMEQHLKRPEGASTKWIQTRPGRLTAMLRGLWGLSKNRNESPRHHAQDAAVVAASTEWMVQQAADWHRQYKASGQKNFAPRPWPDFRKDLLAALNREDEPTKKVFVSRKREKKYTGSIHADTLVSLRLTADEKSYTVKRVPLEKLSFKNINELIDVDFCETTGQAKGRNKRLYELLKERLEKFNGDGSKAFASDKEPIHHPDKNGQPTGPIVRAVKLLTTAKPGVFSDKWISTKNPATRRGAAARNNMVRCDVFEKNKEFYLVPIYSSDVALGVLPNQYCILKTERQYWPCVDDSFTFKFSLSSCDYIAIMDQKSDKWQAGYYLGIDINVGRIIFIPANEASKKNTIRKGTKTLKFFNKYAVNIFGEIIFINQEERQGLPSIKNINLR